MDPCTANKPLTSSCTANTEQVKAVTNDLQKNYYSKPESLLLLIEISLTNEDAAVRQLASVQALRLGTKHWDKTPEDKKQLVRPHLVEGTLKETSTANRHSLARLIAGLVSADMENQQGEAFLKLIIPLNTSDNVVAREVGSFLLYAMLENDYTHFSDHTQQLLQLFQTRIEDPESKEVRINIVRAIGAISILVEAEEDAEGIKSIQGLLPSMVNILKATVEADDEESYKVVFEVFHHLLDTSLLNTHLQELLQFMMQLAGNKNAEDDARSQAMSFLIEAVHYRRLKIQAMKEVPGQLMVGAMHIVTELDPDDDDEDASPARTAIALIDQLAGGMPPRQVIVPLLEQFPQFAANQDPSYRMAAMLSLGNAAAGAPDFISTQLEPLLPTVINLLCDSDLRVRHAALVGLIHLAEEMADEMASHHEAIIAAVLKNLESASQGGSDKKNVAIIRCACGALDTFGDGIDTKIMAQYGPNLIEPMIKLLNHDDFGVKASAASAIGAIASSMEKTFQPYFEGVMKSLAQFVMLKESEEAMNLRSATCDSLGRIAMAVGPEAFEPYVLDLMKASEEALHLDNARLKETSFILWSSLSKVYQEGFSHFLGGVFKGLFDSLELEEKELDLPGIDTSQLGEGSLVIDGKRFKVKPPGQEDVSIGAGEEDDDDDDEWADLDEFGGLGGVTAVALEKEIAIDVLGDIITNSCNSSNLEQYAEETIKNVTDYVEHTYEGCRKSAISTLWRVYTRVFQVWEQSSGLKWEAGIPPKHQPPASIMGIGQMLHTVTTPIWEEDFDRYVLIFVFCFLFPFIPRCNMMNTSRYTQLTQTQNAVAENTPYLLLIACILFHLVTLSSMF